MKKRSMILICGDAGAVGPELIRRQDINILWALSAKEAQAILWHSRPEVCLMEEEFANSILSTAPNTDRTVYLILEKTNYARTIKAIDQTKYVPENDGSTVLGAIAKASGIKFAQAPRIKVTVTMKISCGEFNQSLETLDLSLSGVCVRGFPPQEIGESASLRFEDSKSDTSISAQLIRCFGDEKEPLAAFRFDELDDDSAQFIQNIIDEQLRDAEEPEQVNSRALMKKKQFTPTEEELVSDEEKQQLFSLLDEDSEHEEDCPEWILRLSDALTATELEVARGEHGPSWVENSLNLRTALAKLDSEEPVPPILKRQVLSFCRSLTTRGSEYSDAVLIDVATVRGALLSELYRNQVSRTGALLESELASA